MMGPAANQLVRHHYARVTYIGPLCNSNSRGDYDRSAAVQIMSLERP